MPRWRGWMRLLDADPPAGSVEYDELEFLSVLIEAYEKEQHEWPEATPHEIVQEMAQVHGLSSGDLATLLGGA